jgi:arylsulfatase A-like enzyme
MVSGMATCAISKNTQASISKKPNIIYINIDDMGWTDLGFMGSKFYQTPNIDRLAKQGVTFSNAYAPAANCAPSRASCLTGQYPPRHGIYTVASSERGKTQHRKLIPTKNRTVLADDKITITEVLQKGGYKTCHIGKWHLGQDPKTQGFDYNIGGSAAGHPSSYFSPYKNKALTDGDAGEQLTDRLSDEAIGFMQNHVAEPFFLNLAYYAVHTPLQAKKPLIEKYKNKSTTKAHSNAVYAAMIETLDNNIGRVMQAIDQLGLSDNTFILFSSDNGGLFKVSRQYPLRAGKGSYYEGGIREPLIVRWPGKIKPGSQSETPVSGIDFFPTFLDAAGLAKPEKLTLDGLSLMPILTGSGNLPTRPLYWHFPIYLQAGNVDTPDPLFRTRPGSAMRFGEWKLHQYFEDGRIELYKLDDDIGEKNNLAKSHPAKAQELLDMMKNWHAKTKAPVPDKLNPKYDYESESKAIKNLSNR